jgi:hypothetical protein
MLGTKTMGWLYSIDPMEGDGPGVYAPTCERRTALKIVRRRKEFLNALDSFCSSSSLVAAWDGQFVHPWWFHPHPIVAGVGNTYFQSCVWP